MINSRVTVEQFRVLAIDILRFLEDYGFHRMPSLEMTETTFGTVVYLGKNVGFIFGLDVRDQGVSGRVVKLQDGQMIRKIGYSFNIFGYLIKYLGYRGGPFPPNYEPSEKIKESPITVMIDGWGQLLKHAGQSLLSDRPDSLP